MTTIESILKRLTEDVNGTEKNLYTEQELKRFAESNCEKWDEGTTGNEIADAFVDSMYDSRQECRRCTVCGNLMNEGYCVDMGAAYYCSDECLHTEFTEEEWENECNENDQSYWTQWE